MPHKNRGKVSEVLTTLSLFLWLEKGFVDSGIAVNLLQWLADGRLEMSETMNQLVDLIRTIAQSIGLDPDLVLAIASHESGLDPLKVRYEPNWRYLLRPDQFALSQGISVQTEVVLQKISWGPMQIMGSCAREEGFGGALTQLVDPNLGVLYGSKKLKSLHLRYPDESDLISAYNCGTPKRDTLGHYSNQKYVTDVKQRLHKLRANH